jgi:hypothetical protein
MSSSKGELRYSKQVVCVKNSDGSPSSANQFQIAFSNSAFTNIQSAHEQTKTYLTPQFLSFDYFFNNVSDSLENRSFTIDGTGYNSGNIATVTLDENVYDGSALATQLNTKLNAAGTWTQNNTALVWACTYSAVSGKLTFAYTNANPVGGSTLRLTFTTANSNTIKLFGSVTNEVTIPTTRTLTMVAPVDLAPFQSIRVHSNLAKRTFQMTGASSKKVLTGTDILMEIPVYNQLVGGTLTFVPSEAFLYRQEILTNFDNMSIELRGPNGKLIPLFDGAECSFTFIIEREIFQPTNEDRKNAQNDYLSFSKL